jgi:Cytochrome C assembly protein
MILSHWPPRCSEKSGSRAADVSTSNTGNLDFKQWGLLAIQDGGRRKPVDTFAKETLIRITGRSIYTDKAGRTWRPNDFVLSYAAFALAMGFGHILLWRYARDPAAARADAPMHFWLYRVLQLGVLLLAAGTILGGVWANYSWGRFWGWDPKETWALIALLCYILTLHGRLAGWWTQFGLAVASVVCFLAVLMAWYGVNFVLGQRSA